MNQAGPPNPGDAVRQPRDVIASLLVSGAAALWLAAAVATLFAAPQYSRHYVDLQQDPDARTWTVALIVGSVLMMMIAAGVGIAVAAAGSGSGTTARALSVIFVAVAALVAVIVMVAGAPAGVTWHGRFITITAVLTLLLLAAAASVKLPSRRSTRPAVPSPSAASPSPAPAPSAPRSLDAPAAAPDKAGPGGAGFWPSARRRDVPRWAMALAAVAALTFAATAGILGVQGKAVTSAPAVPVDVASAGANPPHDVIYTVSAPSGVTWMEIVYVDQLGRTQRTTSAPSGLPWVTTIKTGPQTDLLYLAVSIASTSPTTKIQCAIHVDGRRAIASEGPSCNAHVRLP